MILLSSNRNKTILLVLISIVIFGGWEVGLQQIYEKALVGTTNVVLNVIKKDTHITLEKEAGKNEDQFRVYTRVQGRIGNYPQETGGLLMPFVIVLTWQSFLFFVIKRKDALKLLGINVAVFVSIQIMFLVFLTNYYNSPIQKFMFEMMLDNFYIVAIILVIKDNIIFPVFKRNVVSS